MEYVNVLTRFVIFYYILSAPDLYSICYLRSFNVQFTFEIAVKFVIGIILATISQKSRHTWFPNILEYVYKSSHLKVSMKRAKASAGKLFKDFKSFSVVLKQ